MCRVQARGLQQKKAAAEEEEEEEEDGAGDLICQPPQPGHTVKVLVLHITRMLLTCPQCRITRNRKGLHGLLPHYFLHLERGDGRKVFLLAARRRVKVVAWSDLNNW